MLLHCSGRDDAHQLTALWPLLEGADGVARAVDTISPSAASDLLTALPSVLRAAGANKPHADSRCPAGRESPGSRSGRKKAAAAAGQPPLIKLTAADAALTQALAERLAEGLTLSDAKQLAAVGAALLELGHLPPQAWRLRYLEAMQVRFLLH